MAVPTITTSTCTRKAIAGGYFFAMAAYHSYCASSWLEMAMVVGMVRMCNTGAAGITTVGATGSTDGATWFRPISVHAATTTLVSSYSSVRRKSVIAGSHAHFKLAQRIGAQVSSMSTSELQQFGTTGTRAKSGALSPKHLKRGSCSQLQRCKLLCV